MSKTLINSLLCCFRKSPISNPKRTPNYFLLQKFFKECFNTLENEHFSKWIFMEVNPISVKPLNGEKISFSGICFEGSPCNVFWSPNYIPEYIEDFCFKGITKALGNSKEFKISPNLCLEELRIILYEKIDKTYERMAHVESSLLRRKQTRNVSPNANSVKNRLNSIIKSNKITKLNTLIFLIKTSPLIILITLITGILISIITHIKDLMSSFSSFFK